MRTENVARVQCSPNRAFALAREVERWPELLGHYRWVRFLEGDSARGGTVEMAAVRSFGSLRWPVWWVSEMEVDQPGLKVRYRHLRGVTRGMEVEWRLQPDGTGTRIELVHDWPKPWLGRPLASGIVGPQFVHVVAGQTLAGLQRWMEAR